MTSYDDAIRILKNKGIIKEEPVKEEVNPETEDSVRELLKLQEQLDMAEAAYRASIKELVDKKSTLVKGVLDSVAKNLKDAKELRFMVDDLVTVVTMPHIRRTISYKDLSDLLAKELKELAPDLEDTINSLIEESKKPSEVKGQMRIGDKKVYEAEEEPTDLSSSLQRSKEAVKHAISVLTGGDSANEGRFDVPDPSYIEDPYGGWEFEDDVKDIDHNDDYDAWRDNQERDTDEDDEIEERKLTKAETKKKEDIVKSMKKTFKGPESKMYAIATKQAKKSVNEQKDLSLEIDRMNPKIVAKAIDFEMEELPISEMTLSNYFKIQKKVVNKLKKDPKAYDDLFVANSTEMEKSDKKLQMQPVKKDNLNDKPNEMVRVKLKEAIIKLLKEEQEFDYGLNKSVKLPEGGEGTIVEVKGGTLTVEMADGTKKHYQMNVIRHANNPEQIEKKKEEVKAEPSNHKDELMEKIKKYLQSLKKKKEIDELRTLVPTNTNKTALNRDIDSDQSIPSTEKPEIKKAIKSGRKVTV
jgi:hypothetical protein